MKVRALKKRAREVDVEEEKIDEADDADDVKATLISLIMGNVGVASPPRSGSSHHDTWDELLGNMTREYDDIVPTAPPQVRSSRPYHRDMGLWGHMTMGLVLANTLITQMLQHLSRHMLVVWKRHLRHFDRGLKYVPVQY